MRDVSRRAVIAGAAVGVAGLLAACTATTSRPTVTATTPAPAPTPANTAGALAGTAFASGSSCIGAADGQFGTWRGKPTLVAATWAADGGLAQLQQEYKSWQGALDYSPQYGSTANAFDWAAVAKGSMDARFRTDLTALKAQWGDRTSALHYRFQHEMNGNWYPWSVSDATAASFRAGWQRFAGIFREVLGDDDRFRLVWCVNGGTKPKELHDIRSAWPGDDAVDVIGVDYYDFFQVGSASDWAQQVNAVDDGGGPVGIGAWQSYAADHGKPLALPEWGNQYGDNPYFIDVVHDFLADHIAVADGALRYEIYFNQRLGNGTPSTEGDFRVQVNGQDAPLRPKASRRYRDLWQNWSAV